MDADLAPQYLIDLIDTFEGGLSGAKGKGGAAPKAFLEGDRWQALAGNVERSIQGPFYFGESPTCVDFFVQHCGLALRQLFGSPRKGKGCQGVRYFPKMMAAVKESVA